MDDDSQREEAAFGSPSVVSSEISSMRQKEMVDIFTSRQQLKGDQLLVTHSKHTAFTWLWRWKLCSCQYRRRNSETLLLPFSTFRHESKNLLYIRSLFCSQEFDLRLVHKRFPVLFAVYMQWMVL